MASVTLTLSALNKGNYYDKTGVYPLSSLSTNETFDSHKFAVKFSDVPSAYQNKKITGATVYFYVYPATSVSGNILDTQLRYKNSYSWNPSTYNYNLAFINYSNSSKSAVFNGAYWRWLSVGFAEIYAHYVAENGVEFFVGTYSTAQFCAKGSNAPYATIVFSDDDNKLKILSCSPTGGYQAKSKACTFNWSYATEGYSIVTPTLVSSTFRWRTDSSATATEIDCGTALTYTLPASTVSTDSFQWQCEIEDSNGNTATSDWYTISTLEELSTAECIAPMNAMLDGSVANEFSWSHIISTGTEQTKADVQYSDDNGTTWETLATVTGSTTNTTVSASFFDSGDYVWRVRTYNTDNNAGSWSTACSFSVISAPPTPVVTSEQNPRPLVSWQGSDQQGFRITIDDVYDSGIVFGTDKSFRIGKYLDDGSYAVKVKVQNSYGIWSEEGSAPINVTNTAGASMTLTSSINKNLVLTWTQQLSYAYYLVYRDGVIIAKTRENSYTDKTAIGEHTYFIRGIYASSQNYGKSNELTVTISVDNPILADLEDDVSLELTTTDSSYSQISVSESVVYSATNISSAEYPYVELSKHKNKSITFNVAYKLDNEERTIFESLLGKEVSLKTPKGSIAVGTMLEISKVETLFYIAYECTLSQSAYDEEVKL